jgi:hypothetical protein
MKETVFSVIIALLALILVPMICFSVFMVVFFGSIGEDTVIQTLPSPDGNRYAEVIDCDQGALGGDTLVDVYQDCGINAILFKIEKKPQRVYFGDWGEFENMQIHWKDDNCLVINSVEYEIE